MEFPLKDSRTRSWLAVFALGALLAVGGGAVIAFGANGSGPAIALAAAAAIIAAAVVLSNIDYGLIAVVGIAVLLPFGALPLNIGFNPTFLDLALLALFGMWLARGLTRQGGEFIPTPLGVAILVFLVLAVFSFVAGLAYAPITQEVLRHFAEVLISISLFFVVVNVVRTREDLERFVIVLIVAGSISAALGILFYFLPQNLTIQILSLLRVFKYPTGDGVLRFIEDDPSNPMRAISTSIDPNVLGGLMILVTALAVPQLFAERPFLPRRLLACLCAAMLVCMVLTFSRGAMLGLAIALVVVATVRYRPIIAVGVVGLTIFLLMPFTQDYVGHFLDAFAGSDLATQMRLGEYKDALILISRYPLFGVGFGGAPDVDTYLGVSSVYLLMAEEMGLIGLAAFLVTMGLFFFFIVQAWFARVARDPFLAPVLLGVGGAVLGAMIGGLTDHYFFNLSFPHSVALFWLYVGLGMVTVRLSASGDAEEAKRPA